MADVIQFPPRGGAVDYGSFLPDTTDKGRPRPTIENLAEICRRLGVTIRYNDITKNQEIIFPGRGFAIDDRDNVSLGWLISECSKFNLATGYVADFVRCLAEANHYNPVATWIESKPWDGEDRLTDLIETVGAKGESTNPNIGSMKRTFITKWMVSAVAAAYLADGVSAHGVLVFQGEQYVGKTKWFKNLVPSELGVLKDGLLLRPDDRDSVMKCISNWLVELGELDATFRKADIASLKSFLTSDRDVLRRAFGRHEAHYPRRTVFFASVNPKNFLHDETGNRRYWTIEVEALELNAGIDMQQCWAQVRQLYLAGHSWYLTDDEFRALNAHNVEFESAEPIADLLSAHLDWSALPAFWTWRTVTDVLIECGLRNPTRGDSTRAGIILRSLNGGHSKRDKSARYVLVPPRVSQ